MTDNWDMQELIELAYKTDPIKTDILVRKIAKLYNTDNEAAVLMLLARLNSNK